MAVKRVMVIRPGETSWNRIGRWQGHVAVPLTELGHKQAERLATFIKIVGLDAIYSSDLKRAIQTAEILAEAINVKPIYDRRLRERAMGEWQGLDLQSIQAWYPEEYERLQQDPKGYQVPGGESLRQVTTRVMSAFTDIVARGGETVGLISHTTALRLLLDALVPDVDPYTMRFHNMSVTTLVNEGDDWKISQLDDVTHLESTESDTFMPEEGADKL